MMKWSYFLLISTGWYFEIAHCLRCFARSCSYFLYSSSTPIHYIGQLKSSIGQRLGYLLLAQDRKSTRLNSSHVKISYAVFCLKKKKNKNSSSTVIDTRSPMTSN